MAKKNDSDVVFIAAAAAVGLFLIFRPKNEGSASGVGALNAEEKAFLKELDRLDDIDRKLDNTSVDSPQWERLMERYGTVEYSAAKRLVQMTHGLIPSHEAAQRVSTSVGRAELRRMFSHLM